MTQSHSTGVAFLIGPCPFCTSSPKQTGLISNTDILYRCPVCDFPIETFYIMGFLQEYEQQLDQQCEQIDIMLQKRGRLI